MYYWSIIGCIIGVLSDVLLEAKHRKFALQKKADGMFSPWFLGKLKDTYTVIFSKQM